MEKLWVSTPARCYESASCLLENHGQIFLSHLVLGPLGLLARRIVSYFISLKKMKTTAYGYIYIRESQHRSKSSALGAACIYNYIYGYKLLCLTKVNYRNNPTTLMGEPYSLARLAPTSSPARIAFSIRTGRGGSRDCCSCTIQPNVTRKCARTLATWPGRPTSNREAEESGWRERMEALPSTSSS